MSSSGLLSALSVLHVFLRFCFFLLCSFLLVLFFSVFFPPLYLVLPSVLFRSSFCSVLSFCVFTYFLVSLAVFFLNLLSFLFSFPMTLFCLLLTYFLFLFNFILYTSLLSLLLLFIHLVWQGSDDTPCSFFCFFFLPFLFFSIFFLFFLFFLFPFCSCFHYFSFSVLCQSSLLCATFVLTVYSLFDILMEL